MERLFRIEAVNLSKTILETEDLSTRRGGSYMLLQSIHDIADKFSGPLESISIGGSVGLFKIRDDFNGEAADVEIEVAEYLSVHPMYRHATFAMATAEGTDFRSVNERAIAACRWRQMQSLCVATSWFPDGGDAGSQTAVGHGATSVCELDGVSPGVRVDTRPDGSRRMLGASVWQRRAGSGGGRRLRNAFYPRELGIDDGSFDLQFTDDFDELSRLTGGELKGFEIPDALDGKMAVFYADGNGFGKVQAACGSAAELRAWDEYVRSERRRLLHGLVEVGRTARRWRTDLGSVRLETLMWGGDELMFVVPAWCGLELAEFFLSSVDGMRYPDGDAGVSLTHACGLVFAHRSAPISRLQSIAYSLARKGKEEGVRGSSVVNWVVLESFDHIGDNLDAYLQARLAGKSARLTWTDLQLPLEKLGILRSCMPVVRLALPKSQVIRILLDVTASDGSVERRLARAYSMVHSSIQSAGRLSEWGALWKALSGEEWQEGVLQGKEIDSRAVAAWMTLVDLWDYAVGSSASLAEFESAPASEVPQ